MKCYEKLIDWTLDHPKLSGYLILPFITIVPCVVFTDGFLPIICSFLAYIWGTLNGVIQFTASYELEARK